MIYSLHSPKPNAVVSLIEILKFEDLQRHLLRNFFIFTGFETAEA